MEQTEGSCEAATAEATAVELWDIYDENRQLVGRTHQRGLDLKPGDYHLVVHIWLQGSNGDFLITKRAPEKTFPNMWECTGGSAVAGDDSITAALREVKEETGLDFIPEQATLVHTYSGEEFFCDVWSFVGDFGLEQIVLQPGETVDARFVKRDEILRMMEAGEFLQNPYFEQIF